MGLLMHRHESYKNRHKDREAAADSAPAAEPVVAYSNRLEYLDTLTVKELKAFAADHQVDLGGARAKAVIMAVIDGALTDRDREEAEKAAQIKAGAEAVAVQEHGVVPASATQSPEAQGNDDQGAATLVDPDDAGLTD